MTDNEEWGLYLRFNRRLKKIGIDIECFANVPWIYLDKVNGKKVDETFMANHGFTAFWYPLNYGDKITFSDRRKVFAKIRQMVE